MSSLSCLIVPSSQGFYWFFSCFHKYIVLFRFGYFLCFLLLLIMVIWLLWRLQSSLRTRRRCGPHKALYKDKGGNERSLKVLIEESYLCNQCMDLEKEAEKMFKLQTYIYRFILLITKGVENTYIKCSILLQNLP